MNHRIKLSTCTTPTLWCWAARPRGTSNLARVTTEVRHRSGETSEVMMSFFSSARTTPSAGEKRHGGKEWYPPWWRRGEKKKQTWSIQLIFYCMKVSQGRLGSHVNTTPEYRFVSLFYKSRRRESLTDHYYHTNRQIYLTTRFLSHNTYSLVLLPERRSNVSPSPSEHFFFAFLSLFFFFCQGIVCGVDKGSKQ